MRPLDGRRRRRPWATATEKPLGRLPVVEHEPEGQEKDGQTLDDDDNGHRGSHRPLHEAAAAAECTEEQGRGDHQQRLVPGQEGGGDRVEAVPGREAVEEPVLEAHDLARARKPREGPRYEHGPEHGPSDRDAAVGCARRIEADRADPIAEGRPMKQHVKAQRRRQTEKDPGVGIGLGQDERQVRRIEQDRREGVRRPGLHHGAVHHVAHPVDRDVVHEQSGDDLVHAPGDAQVGRQQRPEPARDATGRERQRDVECGRQAGNVESHPRRPQAAQVDLPLGADVEQANARGQGHA
jgi:hypothetical protein